MRKLERRAALCIVLALLLVAGMAFYVYRLAVNGATWVSYPANQDVYTDGYLSKGGIYDRNGTMLLKHTKKGGTQYSSSYATRVATMHAVGDKQGNISTGANQVFSSRMVGYSFLNGTFSTDNSGRRVYLSIDADLCRTAYNALDGHNGTIGVYNYKTGEIVCMVSSPSYDPLNPPTVSADDSSGIYLNKLLSSRVVPGSTFKVITSTAALETLSDSYLNNFTYTCTGTKRYGSLSMEKVTCPVPHGTVNFRQALAKSCNCAFATLTEKIGADNLKKYVKKAGLMDSYDVDGVKTIKGSFSFPSSGLNLAWTGIGQYQDLVNPCSMMVYMGAIANGGKAANPRILNSVKYKNGFSAGFQFKTKTDELINSDTADELADMMHNNVTSNYGSENYPGLDLCAKSGTAQLSSGQQPHSWFVGFLRNKDYPYAFIVLEEHGGWGSEVAGKAANTVLQKLISTDDLAD
ncbi:MAG: penicillin-binding transpeptidase domain-containing protein [Eubacteriales bacterium]|nr:penicillin-binding transpeptidase domain-containing protein [Eubacteriales bacterium]